MKRKLIFLTIDAKTGEVIARKRVTR